MSITPTTKLTGSRVNYYLSVVEFPSREDQAPYIAECNDLIESLALTPDEANIFKEIWRSANARLGNGKPDHTALYGAEKIVYFADRILKKHRRAGRREREMLDAESSFISSVVNKPSVPFTFVEVPE